MVSFSWLYNNPIVRFFKREFGNEKRLKAHLTSLKHILVFAAIVYGIHSARSENYQQEKQFAADVDRIFPQMQMMILSGVNQILQPLLMQFEEEQQHQ